MTLIAGIVNRHNQPLTDPVCASLARSLSRNPADKFDEWRYPSAYFAKIDIGAFNGPGAFADGQGTSSWLTGEPLLNNQSADQRQDELRILHDQCLQDNSDAFRQAEGQFCFIQYRPSIGALTLVTDKVGVRPLYLWFDDELVVFASTLRVMEECSLVPKQMDVQAVTEMVAFGTPLSDRTPFAGVRLVKGGQIIELGRETVRTRSYWEWDQIQPANDSEEKRLQEVHDHFQAAVDRRIKNDAATAAYLSGGLDSRCLVSALVRRKVKVHSFNFARPGTQDYLFGNEFAARIGSHHQAHPRQIGDSTPDYSQLMVDSLAKSEIACERPHLIWSGEGGSVLLGTVHLNGPFIESIRLGHIERAIDEFLELEQMQIPAKLFRPHLFEMANAMVRQGLREELNSFECADAARKFFLFVMLNDQRRKLSAHFENLDLHRLELQLPFFDGAFLESVIETPLDWCLRHQFYVKMLPLFPPAVTEVPWQAYPGHQPCPLPVPQELSYQWDHSYRAHEEASRKQEVVQQASELLRSADFPDQLLIKRNLRLAKWVHATGWRDYRYAIEAAHTYYSYWKKCDGNFSLSVS